MKSEKSSNGNLCGKMIKKVVDSYLRADANSATCMVYYQPKVPEGLKKFRTKRD